MSFRPRVFRFSSPRGRGSTTRLPPVAVGLGLFALACLAWIWAGSGEGLGALGTLVNNLQIVLFVHDSHVMLARMYELKALGVGLASESGAPSGCSSWRRGSSARRRSSACASSGASWGRGTTSRAR